MIVVLYLFGVQGLLGAFDTLYYHEWRARLAGGVPETAPELRLHGIRDLLYAVLFGTLPFFTWDGLLALVLLFLLIVEILLTLSDFVVEDRVRKPLGGVFPGERVTHAVMGIVYGGALAYLVPEMWQWYHRPAGLSPWHAPPLLRGVLPLMAAGVFVSGLRDLGAVYGPRWMRFPWAPA